MNNVCNWTYRFCLLSCFVPIVLDACPICLERFGSGPTNETTEPSAVSSVEHVHVIVSSKLETDSEQDAKAEIDCLLENVIIFPCTGHHLYHLDCLLDWLVVVTRRSGKMTCPCCREEPVLIQDDFKEVSALFSSRPPSQPSELDGTISTAV